MNLILLKDLTNCPLLVRVAETPRNAFYGVRTPYKGLFVQYPKT